MGDVGFVSREILGLGAVILGTGGWLGYVIRDHGKRLKAIEDAITSKASADEVDALEKAVPSELEVRLRKVENGKLGTLEHEAFCARSLRSVEVMVESMKKTVEDHAKRLAKGEELFGNLRELAGELRAALRESRR